MEALEYHKAPVSYSKVDVLMCLASKASLQFVGFEMANNRSTIMREQRLQGASTNMRWWLLDGNRGHQAKTAAPQQAGCNTRCARQACSYTYPEVRLYALRRQPLGCLTTDCLDVGTYLRSYEGASSAPSTKGAVATVVLVPTHTHSEGYGFNYLLPKKAHPNLIVLRNGLGRAISGFHTEQRAEYLA